MSAEVRAPGPAAAEGRASAEQRREGFARALREAEEREGKAPAPGPIPPPISTPPSTAASPPVPAAAPFPLPAEDPPTPRAAAAAVRVVAVAQAVRQGGEASIVVSSGDGLRYELSGGAGGVELRAVAPPLLERVARADLHAVAGACDRRGLPLRRVAVRVEGGGRGGGKR